MPTTRRRVARSLVPEMSEVLINYLLTGGLPESSPTGGMPREWFEVYRMTAHPAAFRADWQVVREALLSMWKQDKPGTRPWAWWAFDAPRWRREDMPARVQSITALDCAEPRRRLGGIGTPDYEVLNTWPSFDRGVPTSWPSRWQVAYYNGRARDIHGNRIGKDYHEGHFAGLAPRVDDPPLFESEAAYLKRHGFLTAAERRALSAHAFAPVAIDVPPDEPDVCGEFPHTFDHPFFDETREDDDA
jgi:hypothetical protein